jgi:F0F1-type ATP synthase membrane subunit b/b'
MRFWTAYAFIALGIVTKAWSSTEGHGEHHASIADLIAPTFNVAVLFGVLIYATKDKLKNYFTAKSEEIANTIERANIKSKEAHVMLEKQNAKMSALESELKNIQTESEADVVVFEKNLAQETEDKIAKMKVDAGHKIQADKKLMIDELNAELLEQVISQTKKTIKNNKQYQGKVSTKMLEGLK